MAFLAPSGNGPEVEEISGNQLNVATRHVDLSDIWGRALGERKIAPKNVLALLTPDSTEGDYAALGGCENTWNT